MKPNATADNGSDDNAAAHAPANPPLVVVVVLTWNDVNMTRDCVHSVLQSDYRRLSVILVDNGSQMPCGRQVQQEYPQIDLIVLPTNAGFCGGSNRGIERALELGADYVHLIGNDSTVHPGAISALVKEMEHDPSIGFASPLLLNPGSQQIVQFYTGRLDRDVARHDQDYFTVSVQSRAWPTTRSDFVPFVAVIFRRQALIEQGMFDESFGTCWEDYDMCVRFLDSGWRIVTVGDAHVVHLGSQTTGRASPYITYYTARNRLKCLFRHSQPWKIATRSLYIARTFWWQIRSYGLKNWANHRAFLRGVLDFFLGVRGGGWAAKLPSTKRGRSADPEPAKRLQVTDAVHLTGGREFRSEKSGQAKGSRQTES